MDTEPRHIDEVLAELAKGDEVASSTLAELTCLSREELEPFKQVWDGISPENRQHIVGRLVEIAEDNVELNFDAVFKHSLRDPTPEVRRQAIEGLWENEEPSMIGPLLDLLANDSDEMVRAAAALALRKFTMMAELGKLRQQYLRKIGEGLLAASSNREISEEVRRRALESAAPLNLPEVKEAIRAAHRADDLKLRVSSLYAMGKNCDPAWLPMLVEELGNSEAEMRFEAANALGELGDRGAVPELIDAAADPDSEVQQAVLQALGKIGGPAAKEYLQRCLRSRSEIVRDAARQALEELQTMEDPLSLQL